MIVYSISLSRNRALKFCRHSFTRRHQHQLHRDANSGIVIGCFPLRAQGICPVGIDAPDPSALADFYECCIDLPVYACRQGKRDKM